MNHRPDAPDAVPPERDRIGVDEWVAQAETRITGYEGLAGELRRKLEAVHPALWIPAVVIPLAFVPALTSSGFVMEIAVGTLLFMLLALGLNIAVGLTGILDLGYVAFYGFGAYGYAWLASDLFGLHWQAEAIIPIVVAASAILGFVLGLPSRRLSGDYLAIVTLFFLQIFLTVLLNADRLNFPFFGHVNLTRGPNGISTVQPMSFFGWKLVSLDAYFYLALVTFTVVIGGLYLLNESRTGRAWRALREDTLAAELMSIPVNRLRLVAFAFGAAVAGLTGTIFAAEQGSVFPVNFDITLLITIYAMVILGGAGNLVGVAVGAIVINVSLEALRTPSNASWLFYLLVLLMLPAIVKPRRRAAALLAVVVAFGFAVHAIVNAAWPSSTTGTPPGTAFPDRLVNSWVLLPADPTTIGKWAYVLLIACTLWLTLLRGLRRLALMVPVLYLAACVWENVLLAQPAVARYILLGAMLVVMMAARPQGILGKARVEII